MSGEVTFLRKGDFYSTVKQRVQQYFADNGISSTGDWRMYLKTGMVLLLTVTSYVVLVFYATTLWMALLAGFALAQGIALIGFNIMHDGSHDAYSRDKKMNWLAGFSLDLMGGNRMIWRQKHNILHHTYTNIDALDNDLRPSPMLRVSPGQGWRKIHRYQQFYAFIFYSLVTLSWTLVGDYNKFFKGRIDDYRLRRPTVAETFLFFSTKAAYYGYALILPAFFHPIWHVVVAFLAIHLVCGLTLAVIFQLAHQIEGTTFVQPDPETGVVEKDWAVNEVLASANFATKNKLATTYFGGMNFQIEHHLFPKVCHVHYAAISRIVEQACREYGITYNNFPTFRSALAAHYRFLRSMGSGVAENVSSPAY